MLQARDGVSIERRALKVEASCDKRITPARATSDHPNLGTNCIQVVSDSHWYSCPYLLSVPKPRQAITKAKNQPKIALLQKLGHVNKKYIL